MAIFGESLLDEPERRGVRLTALALLEDVRRERLRLENPGDAEALHDFRVAVRHLRSWMRAHRAALPGSAPGRARRALRSISQASSRARDDEVFAAWLLASSPDTRPLRGERGARKWLLLRLAKTKREDAERLSRLLAGEFEPAVLQLDRKLRRYRSTVCLDGTSAERTVAGGLAPLVASHATALFAALGAIVDPNDEAEVHAARIEGKRLRYLLQPIAAHGPAGDAVIQRLKRLQDTLGDLHDTHVWRLRLRQLLKKAVSEETRTLSRAPEGPAASRRSLAPSRGGLVAVARQVQATGADVWATYQSEWTKAEREALSRDVETIIEWLRGRKTPGVEVERKYLLRRLPHKRPKGRTLVVRQGYLPGTVLLERVREVREGETVRYYRTVKVGRGVTRTEVEEETTRRVFAVLWPLTKGRRITKRRLEIEEGGVTWQLDVFRGRRLVLAEVELSSANDEVAFPAWLEPFVEREVTGEDEYVNASLAR